MRICDDHALAALEAQRTQSTHSCPAVFAVGWGKGEVMGLIESEAEAIAWAHQMAKTPTPGDHEVADPHPYCLGDDPCCCVQLIAAEQTARADEREKAAGRVEG